MKVSKTSTVQLFGEIVESEISPKNNMDIGQTLRLTFSFDFCGSRMASIGIYMLHPVSAIERHGQAVLSKICHHCGVIQLSDTSQLHGKKIPLSIVQIERDTGFEPELVLLSIL